MVLDLLEYNMRLILDKVIFNEEEVKLKTIDKQIVDSFLLLVSSFFQPVKWDDLHTLNTLKEEFPYPIEDVDIFIKLLEKLGLPHPISHPEVSFLLGEGYEYYVPTIFKISYPVENGTYIIILKNIHYRPYNGYASSHQVFMSVIKDGLVMSIDNAEVILNGDKREIIEKLYLINKDSQGLKNSTLPYNKLKTCFVTTSPCITFFMNFQAYTSLDSSEGFFVSFISPDNSTVITFEVNPEDRDKIIPYLR